jgi:hypothetical protein
MRHAKLFLDILKTSRTESSSRPNPTLLSVPFEEVEQSEQRAKCRKTTVEEVPDETESFPESTAQFDADTDPLMNDNTMPPDETPVPIGELWAQYFAERTFELGKEGGDYFQEYLQSIGNQTAPPFTLRRSEKLGIETEDDHCDILDIHDDDLTENHTTGLSYDPLVNTC